MDKIHFTDDLRKKTINALSPVLTKDSPIFDFLRDNDFLNNRVAHMDIEECKGFIREYYKIPEAGVIHLADDEEVCKIEGISYDRPNFEYYCYKGEEELPTLRLFVSKACLVIYHKYYVSFVTNKRLLDGRIRYLEEYKKGLKLAHSDSVKAEQKIYGSSFDKTILPTFKLLKETEEELNKLIEYKSKIPD